MKRLLIGSLFSFALVWLYFATQADLNSNQVSVQKQPTKALEPSIVINTKPTVEIEPIAFTAPVLPK